MKKIITIDILSIHQQIFHKFILKLAFYNKAPVSKIIPLFSLNNPIKLAVLTKLITLKQWKILR